MINQFRQEQAKCSVGDQTTEKLQREEIGYSPFISDHKARPPTAVKNHPLRSHLHEDLPPGRDGLGLIESDDSSSVDALQKPGRVWGRHWNSEKGVGLGRGSVNIEREYNQRERHYEALMHLELVI